MALPTLTNHCSTTVLGKRHSREITYQAPSQPTLQRLISVGRRVGGAWGRGYFVVIDSYSQATD